MKINMIGLMTDQIEAMKEFYTSVLEFEVVTDMGSYVEFGGQSVRFAICERKVMQDVTAFAGYDQPATGTPFEMAFECESREALDSQFEKLIAAGAELVKLPSVMPWNQYAGFFADPDGHVHELFVPLD